MKFLERVIARMGLMLIADHVAQSKRQNDFLERLAEAAKERGVVVLNGHAVLKDTDCTSDVFVLGEHNLISNCSLHAQFVHISPTARYTSIHGCIFTSPKIKNARFHFTVGGEFVSLDTKDEQA